MTDKPAPYRPVVSEGPYTHEVFTADGHTFSIHRSEVDAQFWADKFPGAYVKPWVPNPTTYWSEELGSHYDH